MNLITVIPLTRQKVANTLSYFTSTDVPIGAIATVPLRSKLISAIVVSSRSAADLKSEIKSAPFEIRRLGSIRAKEFFPASFMTTCIKLADHYASTVGAVIDAVIPDILMDNVNKITPPAIPDHVGTDETYAIQGDDEDRMSTWRSLIRQEFARKKSIAIYVPTVEDVRTISIGLTKGIEDYMYCLHGKLAKKEIIDTWKEIATSEHPVVVIATGSYSLLPRSDIETVIIERENGRGWISQKNPYLDVRRMLETLARENKQSVYLADSMLRLETLHRLDNDEISQGSPFKWRSVSTANDVLVDMTKPNPIKIDTKNDDTDLETNAKQPFRTISPELFALIEKNREESTHMFIFTVRRGHSTMIVCSDCETVVTCNQCSSPVVLHVSKPTNAGQPPSNFFMCHKCGTRRSADEVCKKCSGWRLTPLGIGLDRVQEEIMQKFPTLDIFKLDAESSKTQKQIDTTLEKFRARPGSVLIGTEVALLHLKDPVEYSAIASIDSLFALPDFRIPEKVMYTLVRMRASTTRSIVVQTRRFSEPVFEYALKGNMSDFHRTALADRKQFNYPPYSTLIKISIEGRKDPIALQMADIKTMIEPYEVDVFPAFTSAVRGNSVIHGLIHVPTKTWPDMELVRKLRSLPPNVSVKVDPESLL